MLTVLPDVVLSVVPVVVVTGVDVLPDVVDAGVVVDPNKTAKCKQLWLFACYSAQAISTVRTCAFL